MVESCLVFIRNEENLVVGGIEALGQTGLADRFAFHDIVVHGGFGISDVGEVVVFHGATECNQGVDVVVSVGLDVFIEGEFVADGMLPGLSVSTRASPI